MNLSRPTRACGLKPFRLIVFTALYPSRPTRACGLKLVVVGVGELVGTVTPHTGRVD